MDEKHRLSGFKAVLEDHKTSSSYLEETDGDFRLWQDLSAEGKLNYIVRDAAFYDVPFEQFAQAVRESLDNAVMEEAALRFAFRSGRELHDLESLLPDDGRLESSPPLADRIRELLNADSPQHEDDEALNCEKLAALFKEMRADEAAAKREDAHRLGKDAPAVRKAKDMDIER